METTSTIWLGLTLTCARCHTHKYDPIQHREYYGLFSFFNNLNESVMDGNKPNPDPFIKLPSKEQSERQEWLKSHIATHQKKLEAPVPELDKAQEAWVAKWNEKLSAGWTTLTPLPSGGWDIPGKDGFQMAGPSSVGTSRARLW